MTYSKKKIPKKVLKGIIIVIIVFITVSMLATKGVYDFVFRRYDAECIKAVTRDENFFRSGEEYTYSCGGHNLSGALYKSEKQSHGVIILAPGFRAEREQYAAVAEEFTLRGFDVFLFDATGHGESGGTSSVGFPQIINDLNATIAFVEDSFVYESIFLFGHSRGGYGVCCVLNENESISAVAAVNGVNSAMDGVMAYSVDAAGKIAYANYPFLQIYQMMLFGSNISDRSAAEEIDKANIPVLVIQSENDEKIPKDEYSIYSKRGSIKSPNATFMLYGRAGFDGHSTVLYDKSGKVNTEIIKNTAYFFKDNARREDKNK